MQDLPPNPPGLFGKIAPIYCRVSIAENPAGSHFVPRS